MLVAMRWLLLIAGLTLSAAALSQEIYRWVDKDGVIHFSDQPGAPDAKRVDLPGLTGSAASSRSTTPSSGSASGTSSRRTPPPAAAYTGFGIASPTVDQVFFGTDPNIEVVVTLDQPLEQGHTIAVFLDGSRVQGLDGGNGSLPQVSRGTHFLRAAILDALGSPVATSAQVAFHVRQASVANAPVGPTLKPKPPPKPAPRPQGRGG